MLSNYPSNHLILSYVDVPFLFRLFDLRTRCLRFGGRVVRLSLFLFPDANSRRRVFICTLIDRSCSCRKRAQKQADQLRLRSQVSANLMSNMAARAASNAARVATTAVSTAASLAAVRNAHATAWLAASSAFSIAFSTDIKIRKMGIKNVKGRGNRTKRGSGDVDVVANAWNERDDVEGGARSRGRKSKGSLHVTFETNDSDPKSIRAVVHTSKSCHHSSQNHAACMHREKLRKEEMKGGRHHSQDHARLKKRKPHHHDHANDQNHRQRKENAVKRRHRAAKMREKKMKAKNEAASAAAELRMEMLRSTVNDAVRVANEAYIYAQSSATRAQKSCDDARRRILLDAVGVSKQAARGAIDAVQHAQWCVAGRVVENAKRVARSASLEVHKIVSDTLCVVRDACRSEEMTSGRTTPDEMRILNAARSHRARPSSPPRLHEQMHSDGTSCHLTSSLVSMHRQICHEQTMQIRALQDAAARVGKDDTALARRLMEWRRLTQIALQAGQDLARHLDTSSPYTRAPPSRPPNMIHDMSTLFTSSSPSFSTSPVDQGLFSAFSSSASASLASEDVVRNKDVRRSSERNGTSKRDVKSKRGRTKKRTTKNKKKHNQRRQPKSRDPKKPFNERSRRNDRSSKKKNRRRPTDVPDSSHRKPRHPDNRKVGRRHGGAPAAQGSA